MLNFLIRVFHSGFRTYLDRWRNRRTGRFLERFGSRSRADREISYSLKLPLHESLSKGPSILKESWLLLFSTIRIKQDDWIVGYISKQVRALFQTLRIT